MVLATTATAAAKRGTPVHAVFIGNTFRPTKEGDDIRSQAWNKIFEYCKNVLGGGELTGAWTDTNNFVLSCNCAHGNTEFPVNLHGNNWAATGHRGDKCN